MEEIEVPTEHLHETIEEKAKEENSKGWFTAVAISTALMAVFAAISGLLAGHHSNEALIAQIKSSDQWAFYQAKSIKAEIKALQLNMTAQKDSGEIKRYKAEQEQIKANAEAATEESNFHLAKHTTLASAVTLFQIAIALSAIAILTRKRFIWFAGIILTCIGLVYFIIGIM